MSKPIIISCLNQKGGAGKSTLAAHVARGLQLICKYSVSIADTDPQGTLSDWSNAQGEDSDFPPVMQIQGETAITRNIPKLSRGYDIVVLDGAAKLNKYTIASVKTSDIILIPVQPSGPDIWAVAELVEWIEERQALTEGGPKAAFVISRQIIGTALAADIEEALNEYNFPIFTSRISQRVAFAESITSGSTVFDTEPDSKAAAEARGVVLELKTLINGQED